MDELKENIQQKLAASVIVDKCAHNNSIIFHDSWCTQERIIRFTTPFFRKLFSVKDGNEGKWQTGDFVMYECANNHDVFSVDCVMNLKDTSKEEKEIALRLCKALMLPVSDKDEDTIIYSWHLPSFVDNTNRLFIDFDTLVNKEIPKIEKEWADKLNNVTASEVNYEEGEEKTFTLNKYERNRKAREACLAAHGTACAVCGIDFGKEYGPEFAGKIEVHHIVPISEIGGTYVVDPIKDLIPVCPNCHMALHSKKGGVYTVEELKAILAKNKGKQ